MSGDVPVTVISGATGGIGRAMARAMHVDHLVLLGRNNNGLAELAHEHPEAAVLNVDYLSESTVRKALEGLDRIDRLIHCTGDLATGRVSETDLDSVTRMMNANFVAPLLVTKAALPLLRPVHGIVVFVSSGSAKRVRPGWTAYAASKHAARALAEGIGVEEPTVRVLSVYCGAVDTPMRHSLGETREVDYQVGDYLDPAEVAAAVSYAVGTRPEVAVREIDMRIQGT